MISLKLDIEVTALSNLYYKLANIVTVSVIRTRIVATLHMCSYVR